MDANDMSPCPNCGEGSGIVTDLADNGPGKARAAAFDMAVVCDRCGFTVHEKSLLQSKIQWNKLGNR